MSKRASVSMGRGGERRAPTRADEGAHIKMWLRRKRRRDIIFVRLS